MAPNALRLTGCAPALAAGVAALAAGMASPCLAQLYAVTGDGGTPPETLFSVDPATHRPGG